MDAVEIIAHRGSSFLAPENTLAAANLAWQECADAVEGDFRLTADGHIVCIHDATLKRTAGVDRRVVDCSLKELQSYDVGSWKGREFAGEPVPTLEELLATVPAGKRFFVEVKSGSEIIPELLKLVERSPLKPEQIVLICLHAGVIGMIKRAIPQCPAYWIVEGTPDSLSKGGYSLPSFESLQSSAMTFKLEGLDLRAIWPLNTTLIRRLKSAGLRLCVWTVDDPAIARWWIDMGIDGITTNRPGWLREQLRR
jgi:glycerophosphoryl diester phosphodiesterase